MLSLETHTKKSPEAITGKLKSYFGDKGIGLSITNDCEGLLTFEGGGGYVTAKLCRDGRYTRVNLETREWEIPVKRFAQHEI